MTYEVVVTAQAVTDLQDIGEWLLQHNLKAATATVRSLRERCESLTHAPLRGKLLDGKRAARTIGLGPYLIVYSVEGRGVSVLRIVHGSRDVRRLLGDA